MPTTNLVYVNLVTSQCASTARGLHRRSRDAYTLGFKSLYAHHL